MRTFDEIKAESEQPRIVNDTSALSSLTDELERLGTVEADALGALLMGQKCQLQGDHKTALEHFERALELYTVQHDQLGIARVTAYLGTLYRTISDLPRALEQYERARASFAELGDTARMATAVLSIGNVYGDTAEYPRALEHFERALQLYEEISDPRGIAMATSNIGAVYANMGDNERGLEYAERALPLWEKLGDRLAEGNANNNIGTGYVRNGHYQTALNFYRRARALHDDVGDITRRTVDTCHMIVAMLQLGQSHDAQALFDQLANEPMETPFARISYQEVKAELESHHGDLEAAALSYAKALEEATEVGMRFTEMRLHQLLYDLAKKRSDFDAYVKHNTEYQTLSEEIRGREATQKMAMMDAERKIAAERAEREKERSLLYGALPAEIADRMIKGDDVSGDHHVRAAVLFMDIAGFTTHTGTLEPGVTTRLLADIFECFDEICGRHGVTKIKTIGDSYMAVAFGSEEDSSGGELEVEQRAVVVAQEMVASPFTWPDGSPMQIRIGLHSGPVVAGVIGKQRLQYDVWGDTVNVASRMESTGEPGCIQVSSAFAEQLLLQFAVADKNGSGTANSNSQQQPKLTERGAVDIKGKGSMTTYWLEGA